MAETHESPNHQHDGTSMKGLIVFTVFLLILLGVSFVVAGLFHESLLVREAEKNEAEPIVWTGANSAKAPNKLIDEAEQLAKLREESRAKLHDSPSWIDKEKGIVRIPIERAMAMLVEDATETEE